MPPSPAGSREGSASFRRSGLTYFLGSCGHFLLTNPLLLQDCEHWLRSNLSCSSPLANCFAVIFGG